MALKMGRLVSAMLLAVGLAVLLSAGQVQAQCKGGQKPQHCCQQRTGFHQPQNGFQTFMQQPRTGIGFNLPVGLHRQQPMGFPVGLRQQQPNGFPVGLQQQQPQNGFLIALQQQQQQNGFLIGLQKQPLQIAFQTPLERQKLHDALLTALQQTSALQNSLQQNSIPNQSTWLNILQRQYAALSDLRQLLGQ